MSNKEPTIIRTGLRDHPAVRAWGRLDPARIEPESIEILKEGKSAVYRLEAVGPADSAVIAKQCRRARAVHERSIYEQVLPRFPITAPQYYGFVDEPDGACWLFLEDAGGEKYSPLIAEHRVLIARWLGLLHTSAVHDPVAACLPNRGPLHCLEHLRSARETIRQNLANPALNADDLALLETIVRQCDLLEQHWSQLEQFCDMLPGTLVHGDLYQANVRVRTGQSGCTIVPFDWELAGWGPPLIDLAQSPSGQLAGNPDLATYCTVVRDHWPGLDDRSIQRLANVGTIFRCLAAISWAAPKLVTGRMRFYQIALTAALQAAKWEG